MLFSSICRFISCSAENFKKDPTFGNIQLAAQILGDAKLRKTISRSVIFIIISHNQCFYVTVTPMPSKQYVKNKEWTTLNANCSQKDSNSLTSKSTIFHHWNCFQVHDINWETSWTERWSFSINGAPSYHCHTGFRWAYEWWTAETKDERSNYTSRRW